MYTSYYRSSETQGLVVGTMRYFRASDIFGAKVYFKSWRTTGNFFLLSKFQKWSKSVPPIGQKKCLSGQSTRRSSQVTLSPSYMNWFSSSINRCSYLARATGRFLWGVSIKRFDKAEKIANRNMGAKKQFSSIFTRAKALTCLSSPRVFRLTKFYWPYKSLEVLMRPFIRSGWPVSTSPVSTLVCSSSCFLYHNFSQRRWSVLTMAHPAPPDALAAITPAPAPAPKPASASAPEVIFFYIFLCLS